MPRTLPEDVLHLICQELLLREDFPTLYNCAVSSRSLANLALSNLYRMYGQSQVNDEIEGLHSAPQQELLVQKWSIMWRSIILSALDGTMYPYCRYLRYLELRDLQNLLEDAKFRGRIERKFFDGTLSPLRHEQTFQYRNPSGRAANLRSATRLDVRKSIEEIGNVVVKQAPLIEQLSGEFSASALQSWVPHLKHLQRLELGDGLALADVNGTLHNAFHAGCPNLRSLMIYQWRDPSADEMLAKFLRGSRPHTLHLIQILTNRCGVSTQTCLALNEHHSQSLKDLHLCFDVETLPSMALLKDCVALESLHLEMPNTIDLELTQNDVFLALIEWIKNCTNLRKVMLDEFRSAPAILLPLVQNKGVRLMELDINATRNIYDMKDAENFHIALANQKALRSLRLIGTHDGLPSRYVYALVNSVNQLTNLKDLHVGGITDSFADQHLIDLLTPLRNLEHITVGGYAIGDRVLEAVVEIPNLKTITFQGISVFTMEGLLDFVSRLGPGHQGLVLSVDNADPDALLQEQEVEFVRQTLQDNVGGRLDYIAWRDPDVSSFEGESD